MATNENEICSICIDVLDKNITELECTHKFHSKCIIEYAAKTTNKNIPCPICRAHVIEIMEPESTPGQESEPILQSSFTPIIMSDGVIIHTYNDYLTDPTPDARACCTSILFALFVVPFIYYSYLNYLADNSQ